MLDSNSIKEPAAHFFYSLMCYSPKEKKNKSAGQTLEKSGNWLELMKTSLYNI